MADRDRLGPPWVTASLTHSALRFCHISVTPRYSSGGTGRVNCPDTGNAGTAICPWHSPSKLDHSSTLIDSAAFPIVNYSALFSIVENGIVPSVAGNWSAALVLPLIARSDNLALSLFFLTPYFVFATDVRCICYQCVSYLSPMYFVFVTNLSKCLSVVAEIKKNVHNDTEEPGPFC